MAFRTNKTPVLQEKSVSGSVATFNTALAMPLKSHTVALTATQSGSGTPSPSNPRPISGYSAINISHSGADTSNPTVYTIQIGSTVYGGEYDARTGVLTVTHKLAIFDGSESWVKSSSYSGGYFLVNWVQNNSISKSTDHLQNIGTTVSNLTDYSDGTNVCFFEYSLNFKVDGDLYPTVADFKNLLSQNNLQILYPLPTAEVINLGGMEIDTLQGVNNIWADTGDIDLTYKDLDIAKRGNFREVFKLPS